MTHFLTFSALASSLLLLAGGCGKSILADDGGDCEPQTCEELGYNCGQALDRCNNLLECGGCVAGETCGAAGPNVCGVGTCTPATCESLGLSCGPMADGCGTAYSCGDTCAAGSGGSTSGSGGAGTGAETGTGGAPPVVCDYGTTVVASPSQLGTGTQGGGSGYSDKYSKQNVTRSTVNYRFLSNAWGPNAGTPSGTVSGTSFSVTMTGSRGSMGEPAGFPTVFCGRYSNPAEVSGACGLPAAISGLSSVQTGLRWSGGGNSSDYNTSYDVWLGDGTNLQSYLMVWLRFPEGEKPAGSKIYSCQTVAGAPGTWDIWSGTVGGKPIVNYVRPRGEDISEIEFDVLDFYQDAVARPVEKLGWKALVGTHINSVAGGFEIWQSVNNLQLNDFYVTVN